MAWIIFGLSLLNLATFGLTVKGLAFRQDQENPLGLRLLKAAFILLSLLQIWVLYGWAEAGISFESTADIAQIGGGIALLLLSKGLFWWARAANRARPLSLAFQSDLPQHLNRQGPYRYIRHPFYTAYLLTFIANYVLTLNPLLILVIVIEAAIYAAAARFEEKKFASTGLSGEYEKFRKEAGMFWPKIPLP